MRPTIYIKDSQEWKKTKLTRMNMGREEGEEDPEEDEEKKDEEWRDEE